MSIPDHPRRASRSRGRTSRGQPISWGRILARLIVEAGLEAPELEYPFSRDLGRKHRFDLAWRKRMLSLEVDGGVWKRGGGRHNRPSGFLRDAEKFNLAALLGWRILRCTPDDIKSGRALQLVREALA